MQRIQDGELADGAEAHLHRLLLAGLAGDEQRYREFLRDSAALLRAFLRRRLTHWPDEVEDLLQEALLAIHNQRHTYDPAAPLTAWMHAITKYKLIDWLRRHARREQLNDPFDDEQELFARSETEAGDARRDLQGLLATLPAQQKAAIEHTKIDGWSVRETAGALQISEASVKVAVHRGLKALAQRLRKAGS